MAINFPPGPHEIGDTYTEDGLTWEWNGVKWVPVGGGGGGGAQLWQSADNILRPATAGDGVAVLNATQGSFSVGQDVDGSGTNHLGVWYGTGGGGDASADIFTSNGDLRFNVDGNGVATGGQISFGRAFGDPQMTLDADGRVLVGTDTARTNFYDGAASTALQIEGAADAGRLSVTRTDSGGSVLLANTQAPQDGRALGIISFQGSDGTDFREVGNVVAASEGAIAPTSASGRIMFATTPVGSTTPQERLRINNQGAIGLAGANFGDAGQVLTSQGNAAAPQWATPAITSITGQGLVTGFTGLNGWDANLSTLFWCRTGNQLTLRLNLNSNLNNGEFNNGGTITTPVLPNEVAMGNRLPGSIIITNSASDPISTTGPMTAQFMGNTVTLNTSANINALRGAVITFVDLAP